MKRFECSNCANTVHFDNLVCINCNFHLGFDRHRLEMRAFAEQPPQPLKPCANLESAGCNWLVDASKGEAYCFSCRLSSVVPDLSYPQHVLQWKKLEAAKRHFLFGLMRLRLPIVTRRDDPDEGLAFELLADGADTPDAGPVLTGHDHGLITINVAEASDPEREARRVAFGESLRTLIGHFRHESGHYYWNLLVRDTDQLAAARQLFGDEREDYQAALERHYHEGAPPDWQQHYISAYASAHPWEDFAETWAHYLHIVDGLETAFAYELQPVGIAGRFDAGGEWPIERITTAWVQLTIGINAVNRSIGQPDLYAFVFSPTVMEKLSFMHGLAANCVKNQEQTP